MPRYDLTPAARAEIMKTRETESAMPAAAVKALAEKHHVSVGKVKELRKLHGQLLGLPAHTGRARLLNAQRERELTLLLLLQRELSDRALADRFGISRKTFYKFRRQLLMRPRSNGPQVDLARLLKSIEAL